MILRILYATLATFFFGYLANINKSKLVFAGISGLISISVYELSISLGLNSYAATFLAALAFSIYAEGMARLLKTTATTFAISGLLPVAPGGTFYNAMDAFVKNDIYKGQLLAMTTIINALLLALGILCIGSIVHIFRLPNKLKSSDK